MINFRKGLLTLAFIFVTAITFAQVSITVNVPTAGGFSAALTAAGGDANTVTNLTVTGNINATDILYMNSMPLLSVLDLEAVRITANYLQSFAFYHKTSLTSIKLPNSLQQIGNSVFDGCVNLSENLTLPSTLNYIGCSAFNNCKSLTGNLVIPNSVTNIEAGAFNGCTGFNGTLTISNGVKSISYSAFEGCSNFIGDIIIPNSVITIGNRAFFKCSNFNGNLSIGNAVTTIGEEAFSYCTSLSGTLTILSATEIGKSAFCFCSKLTGNLTIPNTVKSIDAYAFYDCSGFNGTLTLSNSLTSIGEFAFCNCSKLSGILIMPNSIINIGNSAFANCSGFTGDLIIPSSVTILGNSAFYQCAGFSGTLTIPNSITSLGGSVFYNCSKLTGNITIPNSINSIGSYCFAFCSAFNGTLTIPSSTTSIEDNAFNGCSGLIKITAAQKVPLTIGAYTFRSVNKTTCQLLVPTGSKASYKSVNYWKDFVNISELIFVIFNSQGGNAIADLNPTYNSTIAEPTPPTRTGYTFGGWFKETNCINAWNFSADVVNDNTTLYAKWTINTYEVGFNSQGGSAVASVNANYNTTISTPTAPTQAGYTFGGWFKEAACTNAWNFTTDVINTNTTLYAKWTINVYTVTFNSQGGSAVPSVNANYNTFISAPTASTRTGYTFGGWYKEAACTNAWNFATDVVSTNTTLYAKWTIDVYTVTFNSQGGSAVASINANYNTAITAPTSPTRTGYTFGGWYKETTCTNAWNLASDVVTANTTLYAKWTINVYSVSFNSQGGSAVASVNANYNSTITAPTAPTRTGYTFGGWYKEAACTNAWTFVTDVVSTNTTLYAKWSINVYTVTFNSQGGSAVASVNTNYNTTITTPTAPTRTGYTFGGWYKETACTNAWNFTTNTVTTNTSLYAKWTINVYTVTFNSQGGSAVASVNANYNTTIAIPTAPTRTGYTFGGWYKEAACTNAWNFTTNTVTTNTILYAKWTINVYTVTFNSQGGSIVVSINTNYNTTITAPTAPTRTGYTFGGWYKEAACTNAWNFATDVVTTNSTLYAKWTINVYTVTFNSQSGSAVVSINANYNTTIPVPTAPTRAEHTFAGWYKEAACTNVWTFATDVVTANTTLYAKWNINVYTVTFNSQGGSAVPSVNANYNTTITAPTAPTRTGYTFGGWYKEAACTNAWNFTTTTVTANTTLHAKWTINVYTVTFNSQGGSAVASVNANYNTTITAPTAPTRTGYTFGGWYKEAACTNAWNFASDVVTVNTTLYAKWTINKYTITFNSNGGTLVASVTAVHNSKISEPTPPTKTGYTFDGWYIDLSDDFSFNFNLYMITSNLTLQAKWVPNTYYVTFYSEGMAVNSRGAEYNTTVEKPEDPIRTGHIFNGWYKEPTFINQWNFSTDKVLSNMSLYAKWTAITYTVTFDSQGGSSVPSATVNHGAKVAEPTPPTRNGYTLKGWYDDPIDGFLWFFDYSSVTQDMTLYAHWKINTYTINFDSKGGTSVASQTAEYNSTISAPSVPTKTGYTFAGWYKDEALTLIWNFNSDVVTADATLFAKWTINSYIVTFNTQGGSSISNITANYNSTITAPTAPARTGYTFNGWYKEAECINPWAFASEVVTSNITIYAKWTINTYIITFNSQGGSTISSTTVNYNNAITAPSAPIRTGYRFDGWYKEIGCVNPWAFESDVVTSNITLYAKWTLSNDIGTITNNIIKLYPNPAVNSLTVEGDNIEEVTIYSLVGAKVMQPITNSKENKCNFSIDVLESGIYFARIKTTGNKITTFKFIKQ